MDDWGGIFGVHIHAPWNQIWHVRPISSYSHSAEECLPQSCLCNALLVAKQPMNHRRPHQILPQSDPCASPAEIMRQNPSQVLSLRNGKLRLVKVQWSKYKTWRFQVSCWKLSKVHRAVRAVHFCLLFLRHQGHEQLHLITAMPSHSHEPHDSHDMSYDTHVHPIPPHWKPNKFGNNIFSDSRLARLFSTRRLTPWAPHKLVANRAEGTQH